MGWIHRIKSAKNSRDTATFKMLSAYILLGVVGGGGVGGGGGDRK